jgi:regulator of replication initiation timing
MFEEFRNVHNESAGLRKRLRISETENVALKISNQELQHRAAEKEGRIEKLAYLETLVRAGYKKLEEKPKRKDQGSTGTPSNGN